jgi:hypothetical protein
MVTGGTKMETNSITAVRSNSYRSEVREIPTKKSRNIDQWEAGSSTTPQQSAGSTRKPEVNQHFASWH